MTTATPTTVVERTLASGAAVLVDTTDVPIRLRGVDGSAARIRLVDGDLEAEFRIEGSAERLEIRPVKRWGFAWRRRVGPLEIELPRDARVEARSASGSILALDLSSDIHARTTSGDVELAGVRGRIGIDVVSGDIRVHGPSCDRLATTSVSGTIEAVVGRLASVEARSMSGAIRVMARFEGAGPFDMETVSGDLTVGSEGGLRLTASTMSGEVRWEVGSGPDARVSGPRTIAIGGDGPALTARTISGRIRLVPWSPGASGTGVVASVEDAAEGEGVHEDSASREAGPSTPPSAPAAEDARLPALRALARGEISVEEAERLLETIDAAEAAGAPSDE